MTWEEISKELFEKRTEKRYVKENFYNEYAIKKEDTIIAIVDSGSNARKICDELNALHEENEHYKSIFFELVETALTDKNCRELYSKGILDIFEDCKDLTEAKNKIKEFLE